MVKKRTRRLIATGLSIATLTGVGTGLIAPAALASGSNGSITVDSLEMLTGTTSGNDSTYLTDLGKQVRAATDEKSGMSVVGLDISNEYNQWWGNVLNYQLQGDESIPSAILIQQGRALLTKITGTTSETPETTPTAPATTEPETNEPENPGESTETENPGESTQPETPATTTPQVNGQEFTQAEDGSLTATLSDTLTDTNTPTLTSVDITDENGQSTTRELTYTQPETTLQDGVTFVTRTATLTGTFTSQNGDQAYVITVVSSRAEDTSFKNLAFIQKTGEGTVTEHAMPNFDPATQSYEITLGADAVTDAFTLSATAGIDAKVSTVTKSLDGATRILHISVNDTQYTVTVKFAAADLHEDSPAKLTGIYVNLTGEATKGELINGWDPNRLDYTIQIGEKDPSPFILPLGSDDVSISAGDVTQTADTAQQTWTVTATENGATRDYSVTVVRHHDWVSADEKFTPAEPIAQTPSTEPNDPADTSLASHGYVDANGKYVPVDAAEYTIPEGAVFSYAAKNGQTVSVTSSKVAGMTYQYVANVLSPDGNHFSQETLTVTYITDATHNASLQGINVNGEKISGFDPAQTTYNATVDNIAEWTVVPVFDKLTGMSVKTEKNGDTATITVTSADGLEKTVYTVHATQKPETILTSSALATTGSNITLISVITALLAAVGIGFTQMFRIKQKH